MNIDKMTSKERMERFYRGQTIDRVPFFSCATMYSGRMMGLTSQEFYYDIEKSFHAQKWVLEMHGCDGSPCYDLPNGEVLDLGGILTVSEKGSVELPRVQFPITSLDEADKYELPDIREGIFLQKRIEFTRYANAQGVPGASITAGSPFTMVGSMVDTAHLMRWMRKEPEIVHKLIRQAETYLLEAADIMIEEFGVENCSVSSNYPFENNDLISAKTFETFSLPYILDIHEKLRAKGLKSFGIHLCGNQNKNLEHFRELHLADGSFISSDEKNSLKKVSDVLGHQHIYGGNISTNLLVCGTPEEVYRQSERVIREMKYNEGGFALMPSCDLPINTKSVNLYAMLKACRDFGWWNYR